MNDKTTDPVEKMPEEEKVSRQEYPAQLWYGAGIRRKIQSPF